MQKTIYVIIINLLLISFLNAQKTRLAKVTSDEVDFLFVTAVNADSVPEAIEAITNCTDYAENLGYNVVELLKYDANADNVKNYITNNNLIGMGSIGEGDHNQIYLYGGVLGHNWFASQDLRGGIYFFNSCLTFNDPLKSSILNSGGARTFIGGTRFLPWHNSEYVLQNFWDYTLNDEWEMGDALEQAKTDRGLLIHYGIDGDVGILELTTSGTLSRDEVWIRDMNVTGNISVPAGKSLVLKAGTVNLNGYSITSTGGTISKSGSTTLNGLRATLRANTDLRGLCGTIQAACNSATTTNEIYLEDGNFNENVTISNKDNLAMSGSPNYNHFGTLTVSGCDVFQASGFGAKRIYINYGSYLVLLNLYIDGINQSTDGLYLFNSDTYDVAYLTSIYSSQGIVCTNGTEADIEYSHLEFNNTGLYSYNGSNVNISNSYFCGTALDLRTYNFSSIHASSCYFDGGTPSTSGSNISHNWDQSCAFAKTVQQTANSNDETSIAEENGSDFEKINSSYFALI